MIVTQPSRTACGDNVTRQSFPRFRALLQAELARRCAGNPRYSIRAFARWLGIDHATLSQLLRGRRSMSASTIRRLGARMKLDDATIAACIAAERAGRHDPDESESLRQVRQLTADAASLISDWRHFAILELTRLDDFRPDSRWIARVLGVVVDEVNMAVERLLRLRLLEMKSRTKWIDRSGHASISVEGIAQLAVQRLAQQVRELAVRAISAGCAARLCDYSATTMAVRTQRLPEAIARIASFRREMMNLLEQDARRDDVYQLEINFFPLTRINVARSDKE